MGEGGGSARGGNNRGIVVVPGTTDSRSARTVFYKNMGLAISKLFDGLFGKKEMRILMVGLDAAGKVSKECRESG